ncbi:uncharacterized protein BcabD6B2_35670 [Babesia caballi]|uniref:Uncharacterized protein n=1 Tax=Babesia caballi TaxID=5871 RepID=A0AAV4LV67_BABCB|nr:hypothetical protein BcabD6B2_35670 [Babesia caballi]
MNLRSVRSTAVQQLSQLDVQRLKLDGQRVDLLAQQKLALVVHLDGLTLLRSQRTEARLNTKLKQLSIELVLSELLRKVLVCDLTTQLVDATHIAAHTPAEDLLFREIRGCLVG